jgi:hypothetical protein
VKDRPEVRPTAGADVSASGSALGSEHVHRHLRSSEGIGTLPLLEGKDCTPRAFLCLRTRNWLHCTVAFRTLEPWRFRAHGYRRSKTLGQL